MYTIQSMEVHLSLVLVHSLDFPNHTILFV